MTGLVHPLLLLWSVLGVAMFRAWPGHRVVVGLYVVGMLFLPELRSVGHQDGVPDPLSLPGFKLTKINAIAVGVLAGSLLFDRSRWVGTRPRWFDLPVLVWCVSPLVSSVSNTVFYDDPVSRFDPGLLPEAVGTFGRVVAWLEYSGLYDGLAQVVDTALIWGVPYWLGRMYLADRDALRDLAVGVVLGGVLYVPLCLVETRVSPQLHRWVYGFHQHSFLQSIRLGGFRPMVFMEHGLAVGLWMTSASLVAFWLWVTGAVCGLRVPRIDSRLLGAAVATVLVVTTLLCRSSGSLALGVAGFLVLASARLLRGPWLVWVLVTAAPLYVMTRSSGTWDGQEVVEFSRKHFDEDRAASFEFRLQNEDMLVAKALERPLVGWGGWGRSRIYDSYGNDLSVTDGLWVITLGERGFLGLTALGLVILLPVARFLVLHGAASWRTPEYGFVAVLAVVLVLYSIDSLLNAMVNPVFALVAGGLTALRLANPVAAQPDPGVQAPSASLAPGGWRVQAIASGKPSRKSASPARSDCKNRGTTRANAE